VRLVGDSETFSALLTAIGLTPRGTSNFHRLRKRLDEEGIDYRHIRQGNNSNKGRRFIGKKIPLSEVLTKDSSYSRSALKKRLVKEGLISNECGVCNLKNSWCGKPLSMVLDHINGIHDDNRIENLRLLCPNCNSQTLTFAGRSFKISKYCSCGALIHKHSKLCRDCAGQIKRLVVRPSSEELARLLWEKPTTQIARDFGVSDKAVEKWTRKYGLTKPQRGYWAKIAR